MQAYLPRRRCCSVRLSAVFSRCRPCLLCSHVDRATEVCCSRFEVRQPPRHTLQQLHRLPKAARRAAAGWQSADALRHQLHRRNDTWLDARKSARMLLPRFSIWSRVSCPARAMIAAVWPGTHVAELRLLVRREMDLCRPPQLQRVVHEGAATPPLVADQHPVHGSTCMQCSGTGDANSIAPNACSVSSLWRLYLAAHLSSRGLRAGSPAGSRRRGAPHDQEPQMQPVCPQGTRLRATECHAAAYSSGQGLALLTERKWSTGNALASCC